MKNVYKIKNEYVTVVVVGRYRDIHDDEMYYILSDGSEIHEDTFIDMYREVPNPITYN